MATSRICSIPDCGKPVYGFDCCRNHYRRLKIYGDATAGGTFRGEPLEWIRQHIGYSDADCLLWPFARSPNGYGNLKYRGFAMGAHRAMCFEAHGEPPTSDHFAAHSCGNGSRGCVNPAHLRWATRTENTADTVLHGSLKGERHAKAKLSETDVREIRNLKGQLPLHDIAARFGVTRETVAGVLSGRNWGWLP